MNYLEFCKILVLLTITTLSYGYSTKPPKDNKLNVVYQWNLLEYGFPTAQDRQQAINDGNLVPANGVPIDVAPFYGANGDSKIFTTIPRFQTGIPYSLATIVRRPRGSSQILQPYPSYEYHRSHGSDCDGITSAFRVAINECNQMWVIDSGVIGNVQHCPPQLLLFDLNTDMLLHRYRFPNDVYVSGASLFITPIVDVRDPPPSGNCQRSMIYVADVSYHGLIIYDYQQNIAWRAENKYMYPNPDYGTHTVAGESFTLMDGIFGMSTDKRYLYFHALASTSEIAVPLSVLDNQSNFANGPDAMNAEFRELGKRESQCAAEAMDSRGNLYCVNLNPIKLFSWNVNTPYKPRNFREISRNTENLQFVSGMKVVRNLAGKEELWMLSNRFQKIAAGTQNANEVNFRVVMRSLDDVQSGFGAGDLHNTLVFKNH